MCLVPDLVVEDIPFIIPDYNEHGFLNQCNLVYPTLFKLETKNFLFCANQATADPDLFSS